MEDHHYTAGVTRVVALPRRVPTSSEPVRIACWRCPAGLLKGRAKNRRLCIVLELLLYLQQVPQQHFVQIVSIRSEAWIRHESEGEDCALFCYYIQAYSLCQESSPDPLMSRENGSADRAQRHADPTD